MLPTIRKGDHGDYVTVAQCLTEYEPADGEFTALFEAHVKNWQGRHGCAADGVIGPDTRRAIAESAPTVSTKLHRYGPYAKAAQLLVGAEPDGIFGQKTKERVQAYQQAHDLKPDGIVGAKTWRSLITGESAPAREFVQPPNLKQYDKRWASDPYTSCGDKDQTIKSSGCGPTSMADIVAEWWDVEATPPELAALSLKWGCRTKDSGTASSFFKKCKEYYHASDYRQRSGIEDVRKCLDEGGYVVVCFGKGTSGKPGYKKWTNGGHYCVIWGYDDKYYFINDPASSSSKRAKGTREEIMNARKGFYLFWR